MIEKAFTNCFLVKTDDKGEVAEVCLGMKKRGLGKGLWNGAGGKPNEGESIQDAALREIEEEFGVSGVDMERRGVIDFVLEEEQTTVVMNAFLAHKWDGEPQETEEMSPRWFAISQVPYEQMWEADAEWLPIILSGKKIKARYVYDREGGRVKSREITEMAQL